jgi:hypothetical protein
LTLKSSSFKVQAVSVDWRNPFPPLQAVHDVMSGVYPVSEQDAVLLAALQLRADLGQNVNLQTLE